MSSQAPHDPWPTLSHTPQETPPEPPLLLVEELGLKVGDRLGSYALLALLGNGGMGMVFRARHCRLKKAFALKVLSPRWQRILQGEDAQKAREQEKKLAQLPREEAVKRAALLSNGVDCGKRPALPSLGITPASAPVAAAKSACPFAHPYYWAAFVLVGHAD